MPTGSQSSRTIIFQPLAHPSLQGSCWLGTKIYEISIICNLSRKKLVFSRSLPKDPTQKTAQNAIFLVWKDERLSRPCWELNLTSVFMCLGIMVLSWLLLQIHVACMNRTQLNSFLNALFIYLFIFLFFFFLVCVHVLVLLKFLSTASMY